MKQLDKYIHIVCPELPHPSASADMADSFFQVKFLHESGYKIILHCFHDFDATVDTAHLESITSLIHLYPRNQGHKGVSISHPYCISSRSNPLLLQNLLQFKCPVLFQGTSATFCMPELVEKNYKIFVRINGVASELFETFTKCEKSLLKKAYYFNEARLIKKWEEKIAGYATIISTTVADKEKFEELYPNAHIKYLAPFIPMPETNNLAGSGSYCLYFGDMSNAENDKMVHWLSDCVFRKLNIPLIVADTRVAEKLSDPALHPESNICWVSNPSVNELTELIQKAQLVLLPRHHKYGFDKRLVQALEKGRFCICNDSMIRGTGLERLFIIANDNEEMTEVISHYFCQPFTDENIDERKMLLAKNYFCRNSLNKLLQIIEE